jgi:3-polyprenyl-4-hydroxybenzoate decarboxylase
LRPPYRAAVSCPRPDLGAEVEIVDKQSLRGFLGMVERDYPDELVRVHEPVRRELDITSTVFELERAGRSPVVVFERVEGFDMPVVTNIAGNRRLLRRAGGRARHASDEFPRALPELQAG